MSRAHFESRSSFYAWRNRVETAIAARRRELFVVVRPREASPGLVSPAALSRDSVSLQVTALVGVGRQ